MALIAYKTANILKRAHNENGMRVTRALNVEGYIFTMFLLMREHQQGEV